MKPPKKTFFQKWKEMDDFVDTNLEIHPTKWEKRGQNLSVLALALLTIYQVFTDDYFTSPAQTGFDHFLRYLNICIFLSMAFSFGPYSIQALYRLTKTLSLLFHKLSLVEVVQWYTLVLLIHYGVIGILLQHFVLLV